MTSKRPLPGELEPIERASRDELEALQLERLQWSLQHAYANVEHYRKAFDAKGIHPSDLKSLADLAKYPFTVKSDLRDNYPFGLFAVPHERVARIHASSGTTGKPTVVGYTLKDIDNWADLVARSIRAAGGRPGRHGPRRVRLRPLHRRPRRALRRRARRLHRDPDVGRADREAGPAHHRPEAEHHHGHALVHAGADRGAAPPGDRSALDQPRGRHLRRRAVDRGDARRDRGNAGIDAVDIYGLSEVMGPGVASECVETKDGPVVWEDHFYPEIIDPETGEVLPDGEEGELVFTTLTKEALPVIRYRTRDLTRSCRRPRARCGGWARSSAAATTC
jgi:phenylacetate-CoA ligase